MDVMEHPVLFVVLLIIAMSIPLSVLILHQRKKVAQVRDALIERGRRAMCTVTRAWTEKRSRSRSNSPGPWTRYNYKLEYEVDGALHAVTYYYTKVKLNESDTVEFVYLPEDPNQGMLAADLEISMKT